MWDSVCRVTVSKTLYGLHAGLATLRRRPSMKARAAISGEEPTLKNRFVLAKKPVS